MTPSCETHFRASDPAAPSSPSQPIEVKTSTNVTWKDLKGLRTFLEEFAPRVKGGVVLYGGSTVDWVAGNVLAVPWWMVT